MDQLGELEILSVTHAYLHIYNVYTLYASTGASDILRNSKSDFALGFF